MLASHREPNDETREWASLHALNLLKGDELTDYQEHLRGCGVCQAEVRSFRKVTSLVGGSASRNVPSPGLRDRVLAAAIGSTGRTGAPPNAIPLNSAGLLIANSNEIPWEPGSIPGCWSRLLFEDTLRKYHTSLVRLDPGTVYPAHRHAGIEELYLMEGDLIVEGYTMHPGDYCRAEAGSLHGEIRTDSGCKFIAVASLDDQLLR